MGNISFLLLAGRPVSNITDHVIRHCWRTGRPVNRRRSNDGIKKRGPHGVTLTWRERYGDVCSNHRLVSCEAAERLPHLQWPKRRAPTRQTPWDVRLTYSSTKSYSNQVRAGSIHPLGPPASIVTLVNPQEGAWYVWRSEQMFTPSFCSSCRILTYAPTFPWFFNLNNKP